MCRRLLAVSIVCIWITSLDAGDAKTKSSPVVVEKTKLTFDPKTCTSGRGEFFWSYGSCRVEIVGREGNDCVFKYIYEQEMSGDHVATVKVPLDSGPVVIEAKQHSEMQKLPDANTWSHVYTSFTRKHVARMQLVGRNGLEEIALEPDELNRAPAVSLILRSAEAARSDSKVRFVCKVELSNDTGKQLKVKSSFLTAFDAMTLVVTDDAGKELAHWGSAHHKSPIAIDGEAVVKQGVTEQTLSFGVDAKLLKGLNSVKVRMFGDLPGSGYSRTLSTETLKIEIKLK